MRLVPNALFVQFMSSLAQPKDYGLLLPISLPNSLSITQLPSLFPGDSFYDPFDPFVASFAPEETNILFVPFMTRFQDDKIHVPIVPILSLLFVRT